MQGMFSWPQTQHVIQLKCSIKDKQMYTSPQAKLFLLHDGPQTTTSVLPVALCHPGHEAHHSMGMYNHWVKANIKILLFFSSKCAASVFKPHLSLENRDPLNNCVFMLFIQSTWLMYLPTAPTGLEEYILLTPVSLMNLHAHLDIISLVLKCWASLQAAIEINDVLFIKPSPRTRKRREAKMHTCEQL